MSGYWFKVVKGTNAGRELQLRPGITLIGRLESLTPQDPPGSVRWALYDPTVSRTHCAITWIVGKPPRLTHLSQTNDTLVDGQRVREIQLFADQSIQVGLTHLKLFHQSEVSAPATVTSKELEMPSEETGEVHGSWVADTEDERPWEPTTVVETWSPSEYAEESETLTWTPR